MFLVMLTGAALYLSVPVRLGNAIPALSPRRSAAVDGCEP